MQGLSSETSSRPKQEEKAMGINTVVLIAHLTSLGSGPVWPLLSLVLGPRDYNCSKTAAVIRTDH